MNEKLYQIALTLIPGVGDKMGKNLLAHCGSPEEVFRQKKSSLQKIGGVGSKLAASIVEADVLHQAEEELEYIQKENIEAYFFTDQNYPQRLKLCEDGPLLIFYKGTANLNQKRILAMVGTRNATPYGKDFCEKFIEELHPFDPIIISGLAYGIDVQCHKQALKKGLGTIGVMAHGHDRLYPQVHKKVAEQMLENGGGLITEFRKGTNPDRENFPKRNRIVAGISDAIIVVEASKKGGALITAEIANNYNRDVFAVPGRLTDTYSEGCNNLIRTNKAALLNDVKDLEYLLGWEKEEGKQSKVQPSLFLELEGEEKTIWDELSQSGKIELDQLCYRTQLPVGKALQHLMALELKGLVKSHPGKVYSA